MPSTAPRTAWARNGGVIRSGNVLLPGLATRGREAPAANAISASGGGPRRWRAIVAGLPGDAIVAHTAGRKAEAGSLAGCFSRQEVAAELSTEDLARKARGMSAP